MLTVTKGLSPFVNNWAYQDRQIKMNVW